MAPSPERPRRVSVCQSAILSVANGTEQHVTITDISADGFRLEGHAGLRSGDQVYLKIGKDGNVAAEIKWVVDTEAGGVLFGTPAV